MSLSRDLFETCIAQSGSLLRAWLVARAPSAEDADEILQRTFECAWRKRASFSGNNPLPWLFAIAGLELRY